MKHCKKCNAEIAKNAKTCPKCGARLGMPGFVKFLIIVVVVLACVIGCVASCTKGVSDAIDEVEKEAKNEYVDVNGKTEFKVGETFQNKHFKVTITDVNLNWQSKNQYDKPGSGKKYIRVNVIAENISEKSDDISSIYFTAYADGTKVSETIVVADDQTEFGGTISAGKTTKGPLYYEVPTNAKELVLEYEPNVLDSKQIIKFKLN